MLIPIISLLEISQKESPNDSRKGECAVYNKFKLVRNVTVTLSIVSLN